jgi:hypothetical protein
MNKTIKNIVITPNNCDVEKEEYSVPYLLQGTVVNLTNWITEVPKIKNMQIYIV